jgi:hypothetical protein
MHWRDAIQLEMAKITTIKADVRSTLHNTRNFEPQIFAEARYQLQGWCRDLPESMCLHSLLDNDLLATEDRSRTLFTHSTYLSGLILFPQYLAREWITKTSARQISHLWKQSEVSMQDSRPQNNPLVC